jgi:hypothetical protein
VNELAALHNEEPRPPKYLLHLRDGRFFSEVLGAENSSFYREWIEATLKVIINANRKAPGTVKYEQINLLGRDIQKIDAHYARLRIGQPLDDLHKCHGIDRNHPYRKMTLCRVGLTLRLPDGVNRRFLFEKFLVSYSFWDEGLRRSTVTPIHSHPWNHEVVYFAATGPQAHVKEEEFQVCDEQGRPVIGSHGEINPRVMSADGALYLDRVLLKKLGEHCLRATNQPQILEAFKNDARLQAPHLLSLTEGLFRPHRVSVIDDPNAETFYFAINNYWSPTGRVLVYPDDGTIMTWSHEAWSCNGSA